MTDLPDPRDRNDAVHAAREALLGSQEPDATVLAAVQDGLLSVPAGSPSAWFDVPAQRGIQHFGDLKPRHRD